MNALEFAPFAPLSPRLALALLEGRRRRTRRVVRTPLVTQRERESGYPESDWQALEREVAEIRPAIYHLLNPLVGGDTLSTEWLLQALSRDWLLQALKRIRSQRYREGDPLPAFRGSPLPAPTLTTWRQRGLILYEEGKRNRPEFHSLPPVLAARALDERQAKFLPSELSADERFWVCYALTAPIDGVVQPAVACRVPLLPELSPSEPFWSPDLAASTILYTPWVGASWDRPWRRINSLGAIRFAGAEVDEAQHIWWKVTLADLQTWDAHAAALYVPLRGMTSDILQLIADMTLIRLAYKLFVPHDENGQTSGS